MHIDKNIAIGIAGAVFSLAGIYYAVKRSQANAQTSQATSGTVGSYGMPVYSGLSGSGGTVTTGSGVTLDTSQIGNLTDLLAGQQTVDQINAEASYNTGIINAIASQSIPILARGADLAGRGADVLTYDPQVVDMGAGKGMAVISTNQKLNRAGPQTLSLDYSQANDVTPGTGGNATPLHTQMTAHLNETVPGLAPAAVAAPVVQAYIPSTPAAPAPVINNSGGGMCFITTAVCEADGLADDCDELETLRKFRDEFMEATANGRELVKVYYFYAPIIVGKLETLRRDLRDAIYLVFREFFIRPAVAAVKDGRNSDAERIYTDLFEVARRIAEV
jgi:hypothetical protein